ncbi:ABC transporter permease [Bradyrhizobium arachidis]|uniref:ABC transporter permease n=1 Tax=Bradyrhizobium arachidis TaxID=858423 RepID=A0AAE7TGL8_9BRAD|nr:ABC transporter permease [Bradyrhizobium arachidis]QOZ67359.1 ABC transporter permease [Bradyrhizobium arachidis]SFU80511.1 peptide/nickel transport system permease protein [Bradyrhizobium arachidis]
MTDTILQSTASTQRGAAGAPAPVPDQSDWPNIHAADTHVVAPDLERARPHLVRRLRQNPSVIAGGLLLLSIVVAATLAPVLYPADPLGMVARPLLWPGQDLAYPLGTDSLGRDVAAGLMHGARVSLLIGFVATTIGLTVGILIGATAGYRGGRVDDILVRVIELFQTVPSFILLVVLVAIAQPSIVTVTWAIGLVTWPTIARLVRAEFRVLREKEFVMAARSLGFGHARIVFREILPNALPAIIVTASVMVASAILMEAALSFLGLGDPNVVSWGSMIGSGRELIRTAWYLTALPGVVIVLTVLSLNLIGDGLTDVLNPRFSRER